MAKPTRRASAQTSERTTRRAPATARGRLIQCVARGNKETARSRRLTRSVTLSRPERNEVLLEILYRRSWKSTALTAVPPARAQIIQSAGVRFGMAKGVPGLSDEKW